MGEILGRTIGGQFLGMPVQQDTPTPLPLYQGEPPEAESLEPVAEQYLDLVGDHAAHPGTGRGPQAFVRA